MPLFNKLFALLSFKSLQILASTYSHYLFNINPFLNNNYTSSPFITKGSFLANIALQTSYAPF